MWSHVSIMHNVCLMLITYLTLLTNKGAHVPWHKGTRSVM